MIMKGKIFISSAILATSMSMFAATQMIVKQKNGEVVTFEVANVEEVSFDEIDNFPVVDASETPLQFEILSDTEVGIIKDDLYKDLTTIEIPQKVKIDGVVYNVTTIKSGAFSHCRSLTNITIPESITSIEVGAFSGCNSLGLGLLIYNNGTKCYGWLGDEDECTSVVIPEGVKEIGNQAFYKSFNNLTSITFPESLESIGEMAFADCDGLTTGELSSNLKSLGYGAFMYCNNLNLTINTSEANVEVGKYAISYCKSVIWLK